MERRDAKARIRDLSALMDEILASVNASPTRAVDLVLVQKVVGNDSALLSISRTPPHRYALS